MKSLTYLTLLLLTILLIGCAEKNTVVPGGTGGELGENDGFVEQAPAPKDDGVPSEILIRDTKTDSDLWSHLEKPRKWTITYAVVQTTPMNTANSRLTHITSGDDEFRSDIVTESLATSTVRYGEAQHNCQMNARWECVPVGLSYDSILNTLDEINMNRERYDVFADGKRTVAGEEADCFQINERSTGKIMTYCFVGKIPVSIKHVAGTTTTQMTAFSFSPEVAENAYKLPG
jgi:hypothetical protein